jgi:hypothetical protein
LDTARLGLVEWAGVAESASLVFDGRNSRGQRGNLSRVEEASLHLPDFRKRNGLIIEVIVKSFNRVLAHGKWQNRVFISGQF